jgi:cyanophycinase-like exopeptidase
MKPGKEDTMDTELRELLDKANIVFFLGGDPSLILSRIEEKLELA